MTTETNTYGRNLGTLTPPGEWQIDSRYITFTFSIAFLFGAGFLATLAVGPEQTTFLILFAAVAGGYMALNIGANDVANNVGPAVGSGAITLSSAVFIAIIFESAGALIAGGDVVSTISKGIVDPSLIDDKTVFILAMVAALVAGALWLNLATWVGAPVSTTHAIVGGVLGAAVAAAGFSVVNWVVMSKIALSWFISPVLGGLIAALFLALIETVVFSKDDMMAASRRWVPVLIGLMASAFTMYLMMKGFKKIWKPDPVVIISAGIGIFILAGTLVKPLVKRASHSLENHRRGVNKLFTIPLIGSAALLSFAHGANDVANAIGPFTAIISASTSEAVSSEVGIPIWVMFIGASGISLGLALYGARLIRKVGTKLTSLDQSRAYCVCLSAAITVIGASALGLPVSSTHIAVGAVFGVGLFRELRHMYKIIVKEKEQKRALEFRHSVPGNDALPMATYPRSRGPRKLVRRQELLTIFAAWFITVPCAAAIAGGLFFVFTGVFG